MRGITDTVKHLLIINVLMFIGANTIQGGVFYKWFALYYPNNDLFQPWQIITHMFMHGGWMHIIFNMFALWMFGTAVEQVFGARKFLFFYISAGLGAVLLTYGIYYFQVFPYLTEISRLNLPKELVHEIINLNILNGDRYEGQVLYQKMVPLFAQFNEDISKIDSPALEAFFNLNIKNIGSMVGASGAIMGVLVAFGMLFPDTKLMLIFLPVPIKARYFIPAIIALDFISAVTGQSFFSPSNTAYAAHLGGAITGFLMMWYWKKTQFDKNRWDR